MHPLRRLYELSLSSRVAEYDDVATYRFASRERVSFRAGQYVHLVAPDREVEREHVRHMSVASAPGDEELLFTMEHRSASDYKRRFERLEPGDTIQLFGISGEFLIDPEEQREVIFLAGGIGITPIRSLIRHYGRESVDWSLIHVSRSAFLYEEELTAYGGVQHRVDRAAFPTALDTVLADSREPWFYVSGSDSFVAGSASLLSDRGVPTSRIKRENFH